MFPIIPGDLTRFDLGLLNNFDFKIFLIELLSIIPGLKIWGKLVKSITVDSIPILDLPPSITNFTFFLNSSTTSKASTGLTLEDLFALGIAKGKLIFFKIVLITLCFGNLIATVFNFADASGLILELILFFKIKVIGPGQNILYNFKKFLLISTSFKALPRL